MILALLQSGELAADGAPEAAAEALRRAAEMPEISRRYSDLALLRAEMLAPSEPSAARLVLETLAEPGAPYAPLAQEQLALLALRQGDRDGAIQMLRSIEDGAATTPGLQQRASQLIVALEAGGTLLDTAPEPVVSTPAPSAVVETPSLEFGSTVDDAEVGEDAEGAIGLAPAGADSAADAEAEAAGGETADEAEAEDEAGTEAPVTD
jgi:hypothetical protein